MSALTWLPAGVTKEVRALLSAWAACTAAVAIGGLSGNPRLVGAAVVAYAVGAVALGAQSMGHEYSHRTLGLLLAQPSGRHTLLLRKTGVLAAMLLALAAVAWTTLFNGLDPTRLPHGVPAWSLVLVVVPFALFVAPCVTMACRNPLAAVVFTLTIPGMLVVGGELLGIARFGFHGDADVDRVRMVFFWRGMLLVSGAAAVASWFLFRRLEAIEGRGTEFHLPRFRRGVAQGIDVAPSRSRNAVWLLVKKELRLQQMAFVIAGLYVLGWASLSILRRLVPEFADAPMLPLSFIYLGLLSLVIGSLASAEERQFGTLEWQVLLPMATSRQWAVKVGTVLILAFLLGGVMPLLLARLVPSGDDMRMSEMAGDITAMVLVLTSGGLYLSSVCSSGMRAVVLALPVGAGLIVLLERTDSLISRALQYVPLEALGPTVRPFRRMMAGSVGWLVLGVAIGWVALLLRLALQNHRSAEHSSKRLWTQAATIAAYIVASVTLLTVFEILIRAAMHLPRP